MPEPRPQQLITGDRAIMLLDTPSSAALQASGVKLATVSLATYNQLMNELTETAFPGLDPVTGLLKPEIMPSYLTATAIQSIDVLDPITNTIETQFLPSWLTNSGLTSLIESTATAQVDTDPDGTPVVVGNTLAATPTDWTITGTLTASTVSAGTSSSDMVIGTQGVISYLESDTLTIDTGAEPGSPASTAIKLWGNSSNRLVWKDSTGANYTIRGIQTVTVLPNSGMTLGDEVIIAATGEHRVYKGATLGWRLASPLTVPNIAARDALVSLYDGMRVYVSTSGQEMVYRSSDGLWHGTIQTIIPGGTFTPHSNVNDSNFRTASVTTIPDPGFPWVVEGHLAMEVATVALPSTRAEVWTTIANTDGSSPFTFDVWYGDYPTWKRCSTNPMLATTQTGSKIITVSWRIPNANNSNSYAINYYYYNNYRVIPV